MRSESYIESCTSRFVKRTKKEFQDFFLKKQYLFAEKLKKIEAESENNPRSEMNLNIDSKKSEMVDEEELIEEEEEEINFRKFRKKQTTIFKTEEDKKIDSQLPRFIL